MIELLLEGVLWVLLEGLGSVLGAIPFRVWASIGLVALGVVATNMAFVATGPTRPMLFALTGVCVVLSPAALFMWPGPPR